MRTGFDHLVRAKAHGAIPIQFLVLQVVLVVSLAAGAMLAAMYWHQRDAVGTAMGKREARQVATMVYEHLYSVMRKGWSRQEMDDIIHTLGTRLPDYRVEVVRGAPVAAQYGDVAGDAQRRSDDPLIAEVIARREDVFHSDAVSQRYGFAVRMQNECRRCHTQSEVGDVNGIIVVSIPTAYLHQPLEDAIRPLALTIGLGTAVLVLAIFLAIRARVVAPVAEFSRIVGEREDNLQRPDSHSPAIVPAAHWPAEVVHLAASYNTLMERVAHDQRLLTFHSLHDALTGLGNRRRFDEFLDRCFSEAQAGHGVGAFGVVLMDLDGFKPINDTYGHAAGDAVLMAVAKALQGAVRPSDLCARIGGDEFALVAIDTNVQELAELAQRVQHAVGRVQVRVGHVTLGAACSVGSSVYDSTHLSPSDVVQAADAAMYADKAQRKAGR